MSSNSLKEQFQAARSDQTIAVLEGFHTLKHALRFGAEILQVAVTEQRKVQDLATDLAPDLTDQIIEIAEIVGENTFSTLSPRPHPTGVIALARKPHIDIDAALGTPKNRPAIMLHEPRNLANVGAAIRVAAAVGARAVATTGNRDPWDPAALRGSAGLHFALPVGHVDEVRRYDEVELIAVDPTGVPLDQTDFPSDAILVFGSERYGLGESVLNTVNRVVSIPMEPDVSSLNLATAVTAVVYTWRMRKSVAIA